MSIAKDVDDLLSQIDGRSVTTAAGEMRLETKGRGVVEIKPDWKMQLMSAITDPNIALILLMIGIYGILFEFWSPGAIAPGVIGGISLIVALTALSVLPVNLRRPGPAPSRHRPDGGRGISAPASASSGWAGSPPSSSAPCSCSTRPSPIFRSACPGR